MRHNKLAGTRFLLGSRKHKPSTFTSSSTSKNASDNTSNITADCNCGNTNTSTATNNNMLHSKSAYFYRWFSEHLDLVVSGLSTKNTNKVSKASKTNKVSYLVPTVCGAALLGVLGIILNPAVRAQEVYAATTTGCQTKPNEARPAYCAMELGIMMNGTNETFTEPSATELKTDATAYREYDFAVRAVDTEDGYKLLAEAVNTTVGEKDYTNQLVNMDDPDNSKLVPLTTATTGASIPSGQWGYAFAKGDAIATTDKTTIEYKAVPTAADTTREIDTGGDTIYDDASNTHTDMNYKLYFGARAGDNMRSGHYRTQVLLSVVADAKFIGGLGITKMSEMTSEFCASLHTPSASADLADIPTGQLIDDREDPTNGTKYWVSKLADGNCWMTQNMAYDAKANNTAYKNMVMDPTKTNSSGAYEIGSRIPSDDATTTDIYPTNNTYNAHYRIGNYYNFANAATVCSTLGDGWKLPTGNEDGQFQNLIAIKYNIKDSSGEWVKIKAAPLYFVAGGYNNGIEVGSRGNYWSSTYDNYPSSHYYYLYFTANNVGPSGLDSTSTLGNTVRCVVSGA